MRVEFREQTTREIKEKHTVSTSETVLRLPPKGTSLINQLGDRVAWHVQSETSVRARSQIAAHPASWPRVIFTSCRNEEGGERRKKEEEEEEDDGDGDGDFSRMVEQQHAARTVIFPNGGMKQGNVAGA